ncbi:hypothetical protein T459_12413 [Capsicum annuum]|uniref:Uncharacterized protein n=1 Tax=Capsicum annuum TaxID=4072 RepID=A0A2G2ZPQ2_CAPAN|nr:hypothetical protein T459_12413 [Capsicum annuum]
MALQLLVVFYLCGGPIQFQYSKLLSLQAASAFQVESVVTDQSITSGLIDINFTAEMMDPALPPNPKKAVLYRPSVPLLTSVSSVALTLWCLSD